MQGGDKVPKILEGGAPFLENQGSHKTGYAKATWRLCQSGVSRLNQTGTSGKGISNTLTTSDNMGSGGSCRLEYRQDKWYEVTGIVLEGKLLSPENKTTDTKRVFQTSRLS